MIELVWPHKGFKKASFDSSLASATTFSEYMHRVFVICKRMIILGFAAWPVVSDSTGFTFSTNLKSLRSIPAFFACSMH